MFSTLISILCISRAQDLDLLNSKNISFFLRVNNVFEPNNAIKSSVKMGDNFLGLGRFYAFFKVHTLK